MINIYYPAATNYTIPGAPVFTCVRPEQYESIFFPVLTIITTLRAGTEEVEEYAQLPKLLAPQRLPGTWYNCEFSTQT